MNYRKEPNGPRAYGSISGATASGALALVDTQEWDSVLFFFDITGFTGTSITFIPQGSSDNGTTWFNLVNEAGTTVSSGAVAVTTQRVMRISGPIPKWFRISYTIASATVSATFFLGFSKMGGKA